jgi:hypothetical protein
VVLRVGEDGATQKEIINILEQSTGLKVKSGYALCQSLSKDIRAIPEALGKDYPGELVC